MNKQEAIQYTKAHRKAFKQIEKKILGKNTFRSVIHDLDKLILYYILPMDKVKKIHKSTARHHEKRARTQKDYIEMIIDWECARYTKTDKPLDAYDTLYKYYPHLEYKIVPLLKKYNLAH